MINLTVKSTLKALYERLAENNTLTLQREEGEILKVTCELNKPASENALEEFEKKTNYRLPSDFSDFLKFHNGGKLFTDGIDYFEIFSLEEIGIYYQEFKSNTYYQSAYKDSWYMIGYYKGYGDYLFIDSNKVTNGESNYLIYNQVGDLQPLPLNFSLWLDRFIVSQGARYWLW